MAAHGRDLQGQQGVCGSRCVRLALSRLHLLALADAAALLCAVGVPIEHLQGGKLAIYELMAEESAVNYWEKYGNVRSPLPLSLARRSLPLADSRLGFPRAQIAFDSGQKAVLTSCVLINQSILSRKRRKAGADKGRIAEEAMVSACFSFVRLSSTLSTLCGATAQPRRRRPLPLVLARG